MSKNGVMYLVISLLLENKTESRITTATSEVIFRKSNLNEKISSKIYRKDGSNLLIDSVNVSNILTKKAYYSSVTGAAITDFLVTLNSATKNDIYLYPRSTLYIDPNDSICFDFRVFITL